MSSSSSNAKIIIIGAGGLIGKQHTKVASESNEISLVAIIEPTPAGSELSKTYNVPCFDTLDMFYKSGIQYDGALVATPNKTHVPIGLELIKQRKHVLIEKPLSVDSKSAQTLVDAATQYNVTISVGHHRRFSEYLTATKHTIQSGALGTIVGVSGTWAAYKPMSYFRQGAWRQNSGSGGPLLINMIHEMDAFSYLFGDIARVYVEPSGIKTRSFEVEETVAVTFKFKSGIVGTFFLSDSALGPYAWEPATGESYMFPESHQNVYTIFGTRGSMAIPEMRRFHADSKQPPITSKKNEIDQDSLSPPDDANWTDTLEIDTSPQARVNTNVQDIYKTQIEHFAHIIQGRAQPRCSGESGVRNLKTIEAMVKSLHDGVPIDID